MRVGHVLILTVATAMNGCATRAESGAARQPTATFEPVEPTFTTLPEGSEDPLASVVIAPEGTGAGYGRELFGGWSDADGDGCDTRCEVLAAEQRTDLPGLAAGWESIYDGYITDDPSELEVDHVVALAEAWRSGADAWDASRRRAFANDLEEPDALIAVTAATNQSKSDHDAANWQPPNRASWCRWAQATVDVKRRWVVSVDQAEADALRNILATCP